MQGSCRFRMLIEYVTEMHPISPSVLFYHTDKIVDNFLNRIKTFNLNRMACCFLMFTNISIN